MAYNITEPNFKSN